MNTTSQNPSENPAMDAWDVEMHLSLRRRARLAVMAAFICLVVVLLQSIALASLTPLKTIEPVVITVDKNTGLANVDTQLNGLTLSDDEAVTQSLIYRYVRDRETYDFGDLTERLERVFDLSVGEAQTDMQVLYSDDNPNNPIKIYGRSGRVLVRIQSIVLQPGNRALLRLEKSVQVQAASEPSTRNFVVSLSYDFDRTGTMSLQERWDNPTGFFVDDYRIDREAS